MSNEERLTTEALSTAIWPADKIREIRPPIQNIANIPPRYGYRDEAIGIEDIVNLDVLYPGSRTNYAQSVSGIQSSSFPALGVM
jgi:hypothetical protein